MNKMHQIPSRAFRINYDGGFAMASNTEPLTWLINNNSGVHVVESPNVEQAYFDACNQFVRDEWARNPYQQPLLPRFEDVLRSPYHIPGFVTQIPVRRFFATVSPDYIGIYDTIEGAVEFIDYFAPSELKEFSSADEAKLWLNERFILPILVMSAYVTDSIEYIMNVPLNKAVPIHYRKWWQQHLPAVGNLPFVCPQFLDDHDEKILLRERSCRHSRCQ